MKDLAKLLAGIVLAFTLVACSEQPDGEPDMADASETADEFITRMHDEFLDYAMEAEIADWVYATYINTDTAYLVSAATQRFAAWQAEAVKAALQYDGREMSASTRRALDLLKFSAPMVAPDDDAKRKELANILADLEGAYGAGQYCDGGDNCLSLPQLEDIMAQSRDYDELLEAWQGWRTVSPPMRPKFQRFVELTNEGAREFGYADLGAYWRAQYDMSPVEFEAETARLWEEVKPLYDELHCHVRAKLADVYGEDKVPQDGPIPAHLLGNMWSQGWSFIYDILEPYPGAAALDVDSTLKTKNYSPQEMVRSAESFYVSLGMERLPDTFWARSQFVKPVDRDVVCHASAWNMDWEDDLRIKMCIKQTYDELRTIYHELGHNYYQRAYNVQPNLFRTGAHGGFHEAIGDTIVLSMTPEYLAGVGLVASAEQSEEAVINKQMQQALDRIAFLPFGKLIDEWRWGVFSGEIAPENYNQAWWDLRTTYQGIVAPVERSESDFDPGAKYHVPANVSYTRYFLAHVLMFQFHKALCDVSGHTGPLHECSIAGSKEAGERFQAMLEVGASEPWQDTMQKLTGTREMSAVAIIDYFQPLMGYLKEQNEGRSCGW